MGDSWRNHEWIVGRGNMWTMWGGGCWILGLIFAILGIIADAANTSLGLEASTWLLLAIAAFAASISWYIGWAVAVHIDSIKGKKE